MIRDTPRCVEILNSINYEDSNLFGLTIDIFKVRMLISSYWSPLQSFGFDPNADLCFDFRGVDSFIFSVHKGIFGPPYVEDGDLSAISLADFNIGYLDLRKVGKTSPPTYGPVAELVDHYEVHFPFRSNGSLQFRFASLSVDTFDPERVDDLRPDRQG